MENSLELLRKHTTHGAVWFVNAQTLETQQDDYWSRWEERLALLETDRLTVLISRFSALKNEECRMTLPKAYEVLAEDRNEQADALADIWRNFQKAELKAKIECQLRLRTTRDLVVAPFDLMVVDNRAKSAAVYATFALLLERHGKTARQEWPPARVLEFIHQSALDLRFSSSSSGQIEKCVWIDLPLLAWTFDENTEGEDSTLWCLTHIRTVWIWMNRIGLGVAGVKAHRVSWEISPEIYAQPLGTRSFTWVWKGGQHLTVTMSSEQAVALPEAFRWPLDEEKFQEALNRYRSSFETDWSPRNETASSANQKCDQRQECASLLPSPETLDFGNLINCALDKCLGSQTH